MGTSDLPRRPAVRPRPGEVKALWMRAGGGEREEVIALIDVDRIKAQGSECLPEGEGIVVFLDNRVGAPVDQRAALAAVFPGGAGKPPAPGWLIDHTEHPAWFDGF